MTLDESILIPLLLNVYKLIYNSTEDQLELVIYKIINHTLKIKF